MNDFSISEKFGILIDLISSTPIFLFFSMIAIALLIFVIISFRQSEKKLNKWIFLGIWAAVVIFIMIAYNSIVLSLIDNLFDNVFMALYFPNLAVYIIILSVSNGFLIYSILKRDMNKLSKILNIINGVVVNVFLIAIIELVKSNNINVYDELTVYSNSSLLVLLELNSAIFTSWILISLLVSARKKLKRYDKKKYPQMQEIVFD